MSGAKETPRQKMIGMMYLVYEYHPFESNRSEIRRLC